jgi:drug/metabolite transporter (DMT)-like permease
MAAAFWGLSGTVASALFTIYRMPFLTLLMVRMLLSGSVLYVLLRPALPRGNLKLFLLFSLSLLLVQLTYLGAINYSSAPIATMLQYLMFPIVVSFEVIRGRINLRPALYLTIVLALVGIFELSTNFPESRAGLAINPLGFILGVLSALTAAVYTILSGPMIRKFGATNSVTWALITGGLLSMPLSLLPTLSYFRNLSASGFPSVVLLVVFVSMIGTLIPFTLYVKSMESVSATRASLAATVEPLSAAISSLLLLGIVLSPLQYGGGILIISAVVLMQLSGIKDEIVPSAPPVV